MYKSAFCEVSYNEELNIVFVKWKKFCSGNDYRDPLLYALAIMKEHQGCNYVADTTYGFENEIADTQWILNEFIPCAATETSCKTIFFIIGQENTLKEELEGQSAVLRKYFNVRICFGLGEVKQMIEEDMSL